MAAAPQKSLIFGNKLTFEEQFAQTDFTSFDSISKLYPNYVQEQLLLAGKRNVSKAVDIESYTLKTPFGDQTLLEYTPLKIEGGRRSCLYGHNGSGKTLLFEYMSRYEIKEFPKHIHVHHMRELEGDELNDTVMNTIVNSHPYRRVLVKVEAKLNEMIAAGHEQVEKLKEHLDKVQFAMRSISGYDAEERVAKMLRVLGFDENGMARLVSALSGGLRMRVALAMAFFIDADLLLLDEPTNHLDFPSVLWLENRLRGYRGSFLLVTHDREMLNNVCHNVMYLDTETKQIVYYQMGFKEFEKKRATEDKKKFDEIEKFLEKNRNADPSTMIGKLKAEKKAWADRYYAKQIALAGKFTFPDAVALDNPDKLAPEDISLINLQNVRFSYNPETNHYIFNDPISFNVTASTRVGVMGPNGAGKSTFLKLLTHKLTATTGTVTHHPKFTLAYFGQHSTAELDPELTPIEFMQKSFDGEGNTQLRNHLQKTGVVGGVQDTRIKSLSYSQKSCVIFAKLTYICPHLLILDEPTNFLDLESVDSLISACNKYKGALLLVSHNRDFLRKCAKGFLSIVPGHFMYFNDMKTAERSTYTFITELEEGTGSTKIDASHMAAGGGTIHAAQKVGAAAEEEKKEEKKGPTVVTMQVKSFAPVKPAAAAAAAPTFVVGEKCEAKYTDGKFYKAVVNKVLAGGKYNITYTDYNQKVDLPAASLKKVAAAAPAKAPAKK